MGMDSHGFVTGGSKVSRRRLAAGAAWAVPTLAVSAAAPAFAASGPQPFECYVEATGTSAGVLLCMIPPNATDIRYEIVSGGGASTDNSDGTLPYHTDSDSDGGDGAHLTGTLTLSGCTGDDVVITMVAGAGGAGTAGGGGFGNGGKTAAPTLTVKQSRGDNSWGGGGGGGSAIYVGNGGKANASTLIAVAGGGGGAGSSGVSGDWTGNAEPDVANRGGGDAAGGQGINGGDDKETWGDAWNTGRGGRGASGATPGAGGTYARDDGGSYLLSHDEGNGQTGGNFNTGSYGGGDGGEGAAVSVKYDKKFLLQGQVTYQAMTSAGGGGGGYAGGGSGGGTAMSLKYDKLWPSLLTANAGSGGAGSNYSASSAKTGTCTIVNKLTSTVSAANGGLCKNPRSPEADHTPGGDGWVRITYYA